MEEIVKDKSLKREMVSETVTVHSETTPFSELDEDVRLAIASSSCRASSERKHSA